MRITRLFEDEEIIVYQRKGNPIDRGGLKKYFIYDKKTEHSVGSEFDSRSQVVSFLKQTNRL